MSTFAAPVVRPARRDDAAAIFQLRIASWRATYGPYLPPSVWDEIDADGATARLADRLADPSTRMLVAAAGRDLRAYVHFGPCRDDDLPDAGEVYALYAHPGHWSTGLGRALLPAALEALEALGARPVTLWVLEANARARRFYECAGLRWDGSRKPAELLGGVVLPELRYRLD